MNPPGIGSQGKSQGPEEGGVPSDSREGRRWKIANKLWGYDYFLSYHWASGGAYAVALARLLADRGYDCFLDRAEYAFGDDWKHEGHRALRNTQRLVLIATREAIGESAPVAREIEIFTGRSRHVIPIVFGGGFTDSDRERYPVLRHIPDSQLFIVEEPANRETGPSAAVVDQLVRTHRLLRRRSLRRRVVSGVIAALSVALIVVGLFWRSSVSDRGVAIAETKKASLQLSNAEWQLASAARDFDHDPVVARHFFLRAAKFAKDADEFGRSASALHAAAAIREGRCQALVHEGPVAGARLAKDGRLLTWSGHSAYLWDVPSQEIAARFDHPAPGPGGIREIKEARFLGQDESRIFTRDGDGEARLWEARRVAKPVVLDGFHQMALSDDGTRALTWDSRQSVGEVATATLWDLDEGRVVARFVHEPPVFFSNTPIKGGAFSGDGTRVVTWNDSRVVFWKADAPHHMGSFENDSYQSGRDSIRAEIQGVVFSPDGTRAVSWDDLAAYVWDLARWEPGGPKRLNKFPRDKKENGELNFEIKSAAIAPDKVRLATLPRLNFSMAGLPSNLSLWDISLGEARADPERPIASIGTPLTKAVLFDRDRKRALTWDWNSPRATVWDLATLRELSSIEHEGSVVGAIWSPDERRIFSWSKDGVGFLWDASGVARTRVKHEGEILAATFGGRNQLVTTGADGMVRVWDLAAGPASRQFDNDPADVETKFRRSESGLKPDPLIGAVLSPDGRRLTTWSNQNASRWDRESGKLLAAFDSDGGTPLSLQVSPDGRSMIRHKDGAVSLQGFEPGAGPVALGQGPQFGGASFNADGSRLVSWGRGKLEIRDTTSRTLFRTIPIPGEITDAFFREGSSRVFSWDDRGMARLHDSDGGRLLAECRVIPESVDGKAVSRVVSPGGAYVLAPDLAPEAEYPRVRRDIQIWDIFQKKAVRTLPHDGEGPAEAVAFAAGESVAVTRRSGTVWLWEVATGRLLAKLVHATPTGEIDVDGLVVNPDASQVLTWTRANRLHVWSVATGKTRAIFEGRGPFLGALLSRDGARVLSWGMGGAVLWDVGQRATIATFPRGKETKVLGAAFVSGENRVLTWSDDNVAELWDSRIDETTPIADQILDLEIQTGTTIDGDTRYRPLTRPEWLARKARR